MRDFAAIDFETANRCSSSICSVGVVVVRDGKIVQTFYKLVHPALPSVQEGEHRALSIPCAKYTWWLPPPWPRHQPGLQKHLLIGWWESGSLSQVSDVNNHNTTNLGSSGPPGPESGLLSTQLPLSPKE